MSITRQASIASTGYAFTNNTTKTCQSMHAKKVKITVFHTNKYLCQNSNNSSINLQCAVVYQKQFVQQRNINDFNISSISLRTSVAFLVLLQ